MGDFNAIRNTKGKVGSNTKKDSYSDDLEECCQKVELEDLRYMSNFFTWNNNSKGSNHIMCKLDKNLINDEWSNTFLRAYTTFLNNS